MTREKQIIATSAVGIGGNILLVLIKAFVGFITASISIILDALNNLTDALSSIITIVGTKLSNKRPDKKHPFGYGRIEYLTSMTIAFLILFAGGTAIYESISSIVEYWRDYHPQGTLPSEFSIVTLILIGAAIIIKVGIGIFFKIQGKKTNSEALKASGDDALWDSVLSFGTLVGAILAFTLHIYVEGYIGVLIGGFIVKAGMGTLFSSLSSIIGERMDDKLAHEMKKDVCSVPGVKGAYDLVVHSYGMENAHGSIHVEVEDHLNAREVQQIEHGIISLMYQKHKVIFTVGIYALNESDDYSKKMKDFIRARCHQEPTVLQLHGFYVDKKENYLNFDLVIDFKEKDIDGLVARIKEDVLKEYPSYQCVINVDLDYAG